MQLRPGSKLFDYQVLNLAWMFDLERRIALDDAEAARKGSGGDDERRHREQQYELKTCRGNGANFDIECVDMLYRGHGFVRNETGDLLPFPAILDVHTFRMLLRPQQLQPNNPYDTTAFAPVP